MDALRIPRNAPLVALRAPRQVTYAGCSSLARALRAPRSPNPQRRERASAPVATIVTPVATTIVRHQSAGSLASMRTHATAFEARPCSWAPSLRASRRAAFVSSPLTREHLRPLAICARVRLRSSGGAKRAAMAAGTAYAYLKYKSTRPGPRARARRQAAVRRVIARRFSRARTHACAIAVPPAPR